MFGLTMEQVRAMTYRDLNALADVFTEEQQERQRQQSLAEAQARRGRR